MSRARCRRGSPTAWSARLSGVALHDFGCTLKAYRRRVLEGVRLYGEMHRFIPIFAAWQGARVTELVVNHRPRTAGRTKYGLGRTFHVVLDLILIRFLQRYSQRPLHFFGQFGLWSFGLGVLSFVAMLYFKYVFPWPYLWWGHDELRKVLRRDPPALVDRHVLSGGRHEHPPGHPVRSDHANLLRDPAQDDLSARRDSPGCRAPSKRRLKFQASALSQLNFRVDGTIGGVESHTSPKRQRVRIRHQPTLMHSLALRAGKNFIPKIKL